MAYKFEVPSSPNHEYFFDLTTSEGLQSRPILRGSSAKQTFDSIPSIDVSTIISEDLEERKRLAGEIDRAAREVGFMFLENSPVDKGVMDDAFAAANKFFALSLEEKDKLSDSKSWSGKGYLKETNDDGVPLHETFVMGMDYTDPEQRDETPHWLVDHSIKRTFNQWPDDTLPEFRKAVYNYWREVSVFCKKLQGIFALALGLEESALDHLFERPVNNVSIQHYPKGKETRGLRAHADFGAFTCLLQQDIGGLEVLNANAIWIPVPVKNHAFVVNTGNYFEILSNGRWPATIHRVEPKGDTNRYSIPFFYGFDASAVVSPLLLEEGEKPKYDSVHTGIQNTVGTFKYRSSEHPFLQMVDKKGLSLNDISYDTVLKGTEL